MAKDLRLLTIPQVAERLGIGRGAVYTRIASGELPVVDLGHGTGRAKSRVRSDHLDEFIEKLTQQSAA